MGSGHDTESVFGSSLELLEVPFLGPLPFRPAPRVEAKHLHLTQPHAASDAQEVSEWQLTP